MKYTLFNQKTPVLDFELQEETNYIECLIRQYHDGRAWAPLGIFRQEEFLLEDFREWFKSRSIPADREGFHELFDLLGYEDQYEYLKKNLGISLSDQYWICPENLDLKWEDVNLFANPYDSHEFASATFGEESPSVFQMPENLHLSGKITPNATLGGTLKKFWVQKDGVSYLVKGANSIHGLEPVNEWLATKVCGVLEVECVPYRVEYVQGKRIQRLVSICPCVIGQNEEIIDAYSILKEYQIPLGEPMGTYHRYLKILQEHQIQGAEEAMQKMWMTDYLLLNEDRHLSNFGVIRNVETLRWERICPIYDTGRAMNTNISKPYWDFREGEVKFFTSALVDSRILEQLFTIEILENVLDALADLSKEYRNILERYQESLKLTESDIEILVAGYETRVEKFRGLCLKT